MAIQMISYDLHRGNGKTVQLERDYPELYDAIKALGEHYHLLQSTWLVATTLSANQVWEKLKPHIDENDDLLVNKLPSDRQGWLPEQAWKWINEHG